MDTETIDYTEVDDVTETEAKAEAENGLLSDENERMVPESEEHIETSLGYEKTVPEAEKALPDTPKDSTGPKEGLADGSEAGPEITEDETSSMESFSSSKEITPAQFPSAEVEISPEASSSVGEAASPKAALSLDGPGQGTGTGIRKIWEDLGSSPSLEAFSEEPFFDSTEYAVSDLYFQMVVSNRLLGIIAALLVVFAIWALIKFFVRLVADNITNHF